MTSTAKHNIIKTMVYSTKLMQYLLEKNTVKSSNSMDFVLLLQGLKHSALLLMGFKCVIKSIVS